MLKQFLQQANTADGEARAYAVSQTVELTNLIPPTVSYESTGHTLILGPTSIIQSAARQLTMMPSVTLLSIDGEKGESEQLYYADAVSVSGFLGQFTVWVENRSHEYNLAQVATGADHFDVILDLSLNGIMSEEIPVPGYFPSGRGFPQLADALKDIPQLIGTFDKPKFFRLDTELCAHSSRGVKGCERCVDACPAGALSSEGSERNGHYIRINPYLCQGVGTCASACPTEAIQYALPEPKETQKFIERLLGNYRKAGGEHPIILICSSRHESHNLMALQMLPEHVIPVVVEELPSVGVDSWFAALVNGADQVLFAASRFMPQTILRILNQEVSVAQTLLSQLGLERERIDILYLESLRESLPPLVDSPLGLVFGDLAGAKRERLFQALDALAESHPPSDAITGLPAGAPFGMVSCDTGDCTLCMSCVAVCPTKALYHEGSIPGIKFIEQDCIQCGMCARACPEQVLTLEPRFNWDKQARQSAATLHEEEPAHCLRCHKPFAPQSMITMLQNKLRGHSQFSDAAAINRIAMCEDCRVIDVFESMAENPEQQLKY